MSSRDKYHPNYKELYPGIQNRPEILDTLKKSDRKMEYMEVDLKRGTFIYDGEKQIAKFIPSREDSYDQMISEDSDPQNTDPEVATGPPLIGTRRVCHGQ